MYVKDMSMAEAIDMKISLEAVVARTRADSPHGEQARWDLEDVEGRISELTDWY